jgi:hypothetical protein
MCSSFSILMKLKLPTRSNEHLLPSPYAALEVVRQTLNTCHATICVSIVITIDTHILPHNAFRTTVCATWYAVPPPPLNLACCHPLLNFMRARGLRKVSGEKWPLGGECDLGAGHPLPTRSAHT